MVIQLLISMLLNSEACPMIGLVSFSIRLCICNTPHAISSLLYIYLLGTYMGLMTFNVRAFTGMLNHLSYIELS